MSESAAKSQQCRQLWARERPKLTVHIHPTARGYDDSLIDSEIVLSETLVVALVTVISLLVADILYAVADPRISYN